MPVPSVRVATSPVVDHTLHRDQPPVLILTGANGDVIRLDDSNTDGFHAGASSTGVFGRPPVDLQLVDGAGDGARYAGARRPAKPIDLVVTIASADAHTQQARRDRLDDVLDTETYGPALLTVLCPDCGQDAARSIPILYSAGDDGATTPDSSLTFERIPYTFMAPDPVWTAATPVTYTIATDPGLPLLSDTDPLLPLRLAPSQVLGDITISNPGNVPSAATWTVTGPGGPITVYPTTGGQVTGFRITSALTAGQAVTVDGATLTATDQAGADAYGLFDTAPKFFKVPARDSQITVAMDNATAGSSIVLSFYPRYKRSL